MRSGHTGEDTLGGCGRTRGKMQGGLARGSGGVWWERNSSEYWRNQGKKSFKEGQSTVSYDVEKRYLLGLVIRSPVTFARVVSGEWFTKRVWSNRNEWKGNTVSGVSELSPFLLLPVMTSASTSNLGERKRHWAINENQYLL